MSDDLLTRIQKLKITFKEFKYQKLLKRIEELEKQVVLIQKDREALTQEFQNQFSIIEKLLGCLTDAIEQLRVQIQSIQNSK